MADAPIKALPQPSIEDCPNLQVCGAPDPKANGIYEAAPYGTLKANKFLFDCCIQNGKQLWIYHPKNENVIYSLNYMNKEQMSDQCSLDLSSGWQLSMTSMSDPTTKSDIIAFASSENSDLPPTDAYTSVLSADVEEPLSMKVGAIEKQKDVDPDAYLKGYMNAVNWLVRDREIEYQTHVEEQHMLKMMETCIQVALQKSEESLCSLQRQQSELRQGKNIGPLETDIMVTLDKTIASFQQSVEDKKKRLMETQEKIQAKEEDMTRSMKVIHATKLSFGPQLSGGQKMPPPSPTITSFVKQVDFPFFRL